MAENNKRVAERLAWRDMVRDTHFPVGRIMAGIALAEARRRGTLDDVRRIALDYRRARLDKDSMLQRHWQASVSRRPQRGRHHDSWDLREKYVRGDVRRLADY